MQAPARWRPMGEALGRRTSHIPIYLVQIQHTPARDSIDLITINLRGGGYGSGYLVSGYLGIWWRPGKGLKGLKGPYRGPQRPTEDHKGRREEHERTSERCDVVDVRDVGDVTSCIAHPMCSCVASTHRMHCMLASTYFTSRTG